MLAVPLGWATLLLFHPNPTNNIHAGLHHEATRWLIVHLGSLVCIGLIGAVLRLLSEDCQDARRRSAGSRSHPSCCSTEREKPFWAWPPVSLSSTPTMSRPLNSQPLPLPFKPSGAMSSPLT